jgi:phage replication-related protein YjqB (UPF0714/DUF867 family)
MPDKYRNFHELHKVVPSRYYMITTEDRDSPIVIAAPHGGGIEPGTSEITKAIASEDLSYYLFEGVKGSGNCDLHITSTNFDEPQCLELLKKAEIVITVHGEDDSKKKVVYLGGLNKTIRNNIRNVLKRRRFSVKEHEDMQGLDTRNICNIGHFGAGVQLELTKGLRCTFFESLTREGRKIHTDRFREFCDGIREALDYSTEKEIVK